MPPEQMKAICKRDKLVITGGASSELVVCGPYSHQHSKSEIKYYIRINNCDSPFINIVLWKHTRTIVTIRNGFGTQSSVCNFFFWGGGHWTLNVYKHIRVVARGIWFHETYELKKRLTKMQNNIKFTYRGWFVFPFLHFTIHCVRTRSY